MGHDTEILKILSLNLQKVDRNRKSYLREALDGEQPDLCLLPGDDEDLKQTVVCEYEQFLTQDKNKTVMLYKAQKLKLTYSPVTCKALPQLDGINFDSIVCPEAQVDLGPHRDPRRFSILMWDFNLTRERIDRRIQAENIIRLSQMIARMRQIPILIGGDFNLEYTSVEQIVTCLNKEATAKFMKEAEDSEQFPPETFLPSMTKSILRPQRHLFAMRVFVSKQNSSIVAKYGSNTNSDFFIASKDLELKDTKFLDFGSVTGRHTKVERLIDDDYTKTDIETRVPGRHTKVERLIDDDYTKTDIETRLPGRHTKVERLIDDDYTKTDIETRVPSHVPTACRTETYVPHYAPTRTEMVIPPRPPKHHGG